MTQSAQLGAVPAAAYGIAVRQGLNLSDEALATRSAGTAPPPVAYQCMPWYDLARHAELTRDENNTAWLMRARFATMPPAATDDASTGVITGTIWCDSVGRAVYVCADPTVGAAVWRNITEPVSGGGGGGAEISGAVDRILARTASGGASTSVPWHAASATILQRGQVSLVTAAGAVTSPWSPTIGSAVGDIIRVSTVANLTLALPSGVAPPAGYRAEYLLAIQNTSAAAITLTYSAYTIEGESGPVRKIPAGATQYYWIATEDGGATWRIVGTPRRPVALKFWVSGTPAANEVLLQELVLDPLLLPLDHLDISFPHCTTAPSAETSFIVRRAAGSISNPTITDVLRATFAAGNKYITGWTMWNGSAWVAPSAALAVEWQRNDRVIVLAPDNLNGLAGLSWCMIGAEREYQG